MKKVATTAQRLTEYMERTGLSQTDILTRCAPYQTESVKISRPYLSQYVAGKFEPNRERLAILAKAMSVDEVWLMGYDVPMACESANNISDQKSLANNAKYESTVRTAKKVSNIAQRLVYALEVRHMTAAELSRRSGVKESDISHYKRGDYEPSSKSLENMATVLQVSIPWLMGFDDSMLVTYDTCSLSASQKQRELFAKNLQHFLDSKNKTRVDLAQELGVSSATTSDWLNAKKLPRINKIKHISQWLGISISSLLENNPSYSEDDFRQWMHEKYGTLFDMYDKASPEERKKIEDIVRIAIGHTDTV